MESIGACIQTQMEYDCEPDAATCWCRGSGWVLSDWDSWHECRHHYRGQPTPDDCPEAWEAWEDTHEGVNGEQFMVIPRHGVDDISHAWARLVSELEDDLPF